MMKKIIISLSIVIFIGWFYYSGYVFAASQAVSQNSDSLSLEDKKIIMETRKLDNEIFWGKYLPLINAGTLIIAIIGAFISFSTFNSQNRKNRKEYISNLLKELCSEKQPSRIEAVLALSEYDEAIPFIINALRHEEDKHVKELIIKVISRKPSISLPLLVNESRALKERLRQLVCEYGLILYYEKHGLYCDPGNMKQQDTLTNNKNIKVDSSIGMGADIKNEISAKFDVNKSILDNWFSTNPSKKYEKFKFSNIKRLLDKRLLVLKTQTGCFDNIDMCSNQKICHILNEEKARLVREWTEGLFFEIGRVVEAIKHILENTSQSKQKACLNGAFLQDIVLDGLNLSNVSFEQADLWNASFKYSKCIGTNFRGILAYNISFSEAILCGSDFSGSEIDFGNFRKTMLHGASFRDCKGRQVSFRGAHCDWNDVSLVKNIKSVKHFIRKNRQLDFSGSTLPECDFSGSELPGASFEKANLYGSNFSNAKIWDVDFTGSNQHNVDFSNTGINNRRREAEPMNNVDSMNL